MFGAAGARRRDDAQATAQEEQEPQSAEGEGEAKQDGRRSEGQRHPGPSARAASPKMQSIETKMVRVVLLFSLPCLCKLLSFPFLCACVCFCSCACVLLPLSSLFKNTACPGSGCSSSFSSPLPFSAPAHQHDPHGRVPAYRITACGEESLLSSLPAAAAHPRSADGAATQVWLLLCFLFFSVSFFFVSSSLNPLVGGIRRNHAAAGDTKHWQGQGTQAQAQAAS